MFNELTFQIRVTNFAEGKRWYKAFLQKEPDFVPHDGFAEWELLSGAWLQLAEGEPAEGSGPVRLCVQNLEDERERMLNELAVAPFTIHSREEVPVKWATFSDPWGNKLGFFEYIRKEQSVE
ncbi:MAG: VOC family protein [Anaerobacillus sp.]